jgi:hypothetical protein
MTTRTDLLNQMATDARQRYAAAQIVGALRDGAIRRSYAERLWILADRYRVAKAEGRTQAARAIKERAMRLADEAYGEG